MKRAHRIDDTAGAPGTGASIVTPGDMPSKLATVTAEVLCRLLAGERLTAIDTVTDASTTRLAAVVGRLQSDYGWRIDREDRAAGCRDGRLTWVKEYWLSADTRRRAMDAGASAWCANVRRARAELRTQAAKARRAADRANAARLTRPHAGQRGLFDGEGAPA